MEITEKNFQKILPEVKNAISEATFISIDTEFSGLASRDAAAIRLYDSPAEAYDKLRSNSSFVVLQFGLCTFHENDDDSTLFTHRAYNFFILPSQPEFACQTESLVFLAKCGLDISKVFKDGIVSLTPQEIEAQRTFLEEKKKALEQLVSVASSETKTTNHITNIPEKEKELINSTKEKIEEFLTSSSESCLVLNRCNGFQRLLLYQLLEAEFEGQAYMITRTDEKRNRELVVYRGGKEQKYAAELEQIQLREKELSDNFGFSAVLSAIRNSGKLVVGHNMTLDILHTLHQFYEDIPQDLLSFKKLAHSKFPNVVDTKMMACKKPLRDKIESTVLDQLAKALSSAPFNLRDVGVAEGSVGYKTEKDQCHEAGFDAYLTGLCFISMASYLGQNKSLTDIIESDTLQAYRNKLLFAPFADGGYFDLCGKESNPETNHVFHMQVPNEWKSSDVAELFSPYGSVRVIWQSKEDCLVALDKREEASRVKDVMEKASKGSKNYKFQTYAKYKANKEKINRMNICNLEGRRRRTSDNCTEQSVKKLKNTNGSSEAKSANMEAAQDTTNKLFDETAPWD